MGFGDRDMAPTTGIGVKKPGIIEKCSKEEYEARIKAIVRSKRDIAWWAENFFNIITMDDGMKVIKLYPKQREFLQHLAKHNKTICLSARQTGKTTSYTIFCLWLATLFPEKAIMICANKLQTALEIMKRLRDAYEQLPQFIKPGVLVYNKGEILFSNMSSIKAFSTSSSAARGQSGNCIVIDEMAFIPKNIIDDFFASVMPVISSGKNSKAIIVSTPNGASGLYYDLWKEANENEKNGVLEGWQPFRIRWWETGGIRNEKWKQEQIASIGETRWRQEYECEFLAGASINKLVPDDIREKFERKIAEYHAQGIDKGKLLNIVSETEDKVYKFTMWHEFQEDHTYLAAGDVAEGTGNDNSVLYIWDITHLDNIIQCAKFASPNVSTIEFAFVCNKILNLYHCPPFICESNGVGAGFLDSLRVTYGYQNIVKEGKNGAYGIKSHVQTKGRATLWLNEMLTTQGFGWTIYDKDLIQEMETFIRKDSKEHVIYQAMQGCHDDFIMTLVWTAWMLNPDIVQTYYIVAESFTSTLGKILPKTIMPIDEYTLGGISRATSDPLYKQFIDYKMEMMDKLHIAVDAEKKEEMQFRKQFPDIYFGDDDGPSWNCPSSGRSAQSMFGQSAPAFYIN